MTKKYQKIKYLERCVPTLQHEERKRKQRQLKKLSHQFDSVGSMFRSTRELDMTMTSYFNDTLSSKNALQYDINTRLYLAPFMMGNGFESCTAMMASLNMEGTVSTRRSFSRHQPTVTNDIRVVTKMAIKQAMDGEIKASILEQLTADNVTIECAELLYSKWKSGEKVHEIQNVGLTVSFDMAWQKRGSGNRYDSISGHGIMIGGITKKVLGIIVYSMKCDKCSNARKKLHPSYETCMSNELCGVIQRNGGHCGFGNDTIN